MRFLHCNELCRSLLTAMLTVTMATTAIAQTNRISRTETDINELSRRLAPGEIGNIDDLRSRSSLSRARAIDYSKIDRRALTNLVKEAYDESGRLYNSLDADYRRYPQLRSLMSDLSQLRTATNRVLQDLNANVDLSIVVEDFRQIDADWRLFSYRMSQARGTSSTTKQSVERIDNIDQRIGQLFQVDPSLDQKALLQQLASLESSLYNLSDELARDANGYNFVTSSRKLEQMVARVETMVLDNYPYERIVGEYNRFESAWVTLMGQLGTLRNSYVERTIARISDADYRVHELLWIENTTSRVQLKQTADALIRKVDEFYNRAPLKLLLGLQNADKALQVANDFYGTVQNFQSNLENNESDAQLVESYRYIEEYGKSFTRTFRQIKSQTAIVVLQEIEDGIAALRRELNLGGTVSQVDTEQLYTIAASLEDLADQLDLDIRQWMNRERPPYRNEVTAASQAFIKRTQRVHRMLDSEPRLQDLQRETENLYTEWRTLYSYFSRCQNASDRANLSYRSRLVNEDLIELDSLLRL